MNRLTRVLLTAGVLLAMAFTFSCSSGNDDGFQPPSSSSSVSSPSGTSSPSGGRGNDIANYITKEIGDQTWMAENLDYAIGDSKCYYNDPANCDTYGRLYDWATAMALPANCNSETCAITAKHRGLCPAGWHIPSDAEWSALMTAVGGESAAGKKLKAADGWNSGGNGDDTYGFAALPGGFGYSGGYFFNFFNFGDFGYWWSATESGSDHAYARNMFYDDEDVASGSSGKSSLFSVRCLQD